MTREEAIEALKQPELCEDAVSIEDVLAELDEWREVFDENGHKESCADMKLVRKSMSLLPSAQPEVIHCKDCKHRDYWGSCKKLNSVFNGHKTVTFDDCFYCGFAEGKVVAKITVSAEEMAEELRKRLDEVKTTPVTILPSEQIHCNQCKYYDGVHGFMGHAPCTFWKSGGVLYNWYCSQAERVEDGDR